MICFIILHYMVIEETIQCIKNLQNLKCDKKIIIVDNASTNNSGKKLKEIYSSDNNIDIILNERNVGFAQGNNIGCEFAKNRYNPDFYIVMNNDVEIQQENFIEEIYRIYAEDEFDILSPDIYSTSQNVHQSPKSLSRTSLEKAKKLKNKYYIKIKYKTLSKLRCLLKNIKILKKLLYLINKNNIDYSKKYYDVPLHGACFIFSKKFVQKRKNVFFDKTFMYYESEILDYECNLYGFKEVYDPSIQVLHHQNVSTNNIFKKNVDKALFMSKQNYNSICEFLNEYDK